MENWLSFVSVVASFMTFIGFISVFVKWGKERGESIAYSKEMRKDIEKNEKDINALGSRVNKMEIENTKLITTLTSDLNWIKSSLTEIKTEISKREKEGV